MEVTSKVQKWGNSSAVRIPKKVMEQLKIEDGQELVIHVRQEGLLLTPTPEPEQITLADLLRDMTPEKVGGELDWGPAVGKEIIDD